MHYIYCNVVNEVIFPLNLRKMSIIPKKAATAFLFASPRINSLASLHVISSAIAVEGSLSHKREKDSL